MVAQARGRPAVGMSGAWQRPRPGAQGHAVGVQQLAAAVFLAARRRGPAGEAAFPPV
jgi:hypothetical protein